MIHQSNATDEQTDQHADPAAKSGVGGQTSYPDLKARAERERKYHLGSHPLLMAIYETCIAIEKCGASLELTDAVTHAVGLYEPARILLEERDAALAERGDEQGIAQDDLAAILRAVGLPDAARPCSAHEVVQRELLPHLRALASRPVIAAPADGLAELRERCAKENDEICQILGRALGYPRYCDDQKNFPGATDADGVCVGDHVAASLLTPESRAALRSLLKQISADARERAEKCWRTHKAPMAAYWRAVAVYANHASRIVAP